jgi:outer membrane immunogenic protein
MRAKLLCTTMGVLVSGTAMLGGSAMAADLASARMAPPPPIMTQYSWSGFYVGAFGGVTAWDPNLWFGGSGSGYSYNDSYNGRAAFGGLFGGDVGYNWQTGSFVYGLEGDFAGVFGGKSTFYWENSYGVGAQTQAIGTIRARAGVAVDRALIYLTAGFAEIDVKNSAWADGSGYSGTSWVPALAVGGGVEYALDNHWSIKAEGLYLAAATQKNSVTVGSCRCSFGSTPSQAVLKFGVNYKF